MRLNLLVGLLLIAGCSTSTPAQHDAGAIDAGLPDASDAGWIAPPYCLAEHESTLDGVGPITVCDSAFTERPFVHLPVDYADASGEHVFGGIVHAGPDLVFRARGRDISLASNPTWLADEAGVPGNVRYGYVLYDAVVSAGSVVSVRPIVQIDDRVFQRYLRSLTFEGRVSVRTPGTTPTFSAPTQRVRVRFADDIDAAPFDEEVMFERYAIRVTIENATERVTSSDGSCLDALTDLGETNPLATATDNVAFALRHPNMHGAFDDVFTWDWPAGTVEGGLNNMGGGLYIAPAHLAIEPTAELEEANSSPHGNPIYGPSIELARVSGGGDPCTN